MLKKVPCPQTKDDMRNFGLSPYFNKGLEKVLVDLLLPYVCRFLSRDQLGVRKGCSINHHLARLIDFLYAEIYSESQKNRKAVAAITVDLSKAFNRLDHGKLLTMFFDMGVPVSAPRLLRSYLSGRTMQVHLPDAVSTVYELWGGHLKEVY